MTRFRLVLIRVYSFQTRVDSCKSRIDLCWYSCIRIDLIVLNIFKHVFTFHIPHTLQVLITIDNCSKLLTFYINSNIVTRNNIVWKLARGYCLCYCKTFSFQTPQSAQKFLLPKSVVHYLCHLNWLRVISCQEQINRLLVVIHHENIHELASLRFPNLNLE